MTSITYITINFSENFYVIMYIYCFYEIKFVLVNFQDKTCDYPIILPFALRSQVFLNLHIFFVLIDYIFCNLVSMYIILFSTGNLKI